MPWKQEREVVGQEQGTTEKETEEMGNLIIVEAFCRNNAGF